jgi:hypothetical protein
MKMWIARDLNGGLFLFSEKPRLIRDHHYWCGNNWYKINRNLFPEVTFENSPQEVEIVLKTGAI